MLSMGPDSSPRASKGVRQAVVVADGGRIGLSLSRSGWVCPFVMAHLSPGVSNWGPARCLQYHGNHVTPGQGAASEVALTPSNLKLWSQDRDYNSFDDKMTVNNYSTVSILFFNLIGILINIVYQYKWYAFTSTLVIFVEGSALWAF